MDETTRLELVKIGFRRMLAMRYPLCKCDAIADILAGLANEVLTLDEEVQRMRQANA